MNRNNASESNVYKEVQKIQVQTNLSFNLLAVKVKMETFHRICMKIQHIFPEAELSLVTILW